MTYLSTKKIYISIVISFLIGLITIASFLLINVIRNKQELSTQSFYAKTVAKEIMSDGTIRSQNEASLHFVTGGKLTYLPFKEGETIKKGQTIAALDSYTIQKQLQAALNTYRTVRDSFDQVKDNIQDNVSKAQQTYPYDMYAKAGMGIETKENAINDAIKRILDQNQANLDTSVIQVELANYAFTLSTLTSPIDGILIHQDVSTPNVIVGPQITFVVIDPHFLVFKANVAENEIGYIEEGSPALIKLNGDVQSTFQGIVTKIYPEKSILPNGEQIYQVDIASKELTENSIYRQNGVAFIQNKKQSLVFLVPSWLVLNKKFIWVIRNAKPALLPISIGETVGGMTEVINGLNTRDRIVSNPKKLVTSHYLIP